jgi:HlyD family secretion protein
MEMEIERGMKTVSDQRPRTNGRQSHKLRRWLPGLGACAVVGLIVAGLWPRPMPVETAKAVIGPLLATVNEEGKTRIKQRFTMTAPVSGLLRRIPFKAGAEVVSNQTVVAVIDPLPPALLDARTRAMAEAQRDVAAAHLARAREAHRFAVSELRRVEKLFSERTVSEQEFENVQWREVMAARELAAAEGSLRQSEAELAEFNVASGDGASRSRAPVELKAPASGRILRLFEESARVVESGTPLLEIGDPTDLEVVIEVLSRDGAVIVPGTRVELEHWGGPEPLQARVRLVEPAAFTKVSALGVEEQRVNVVADLITPLEQRSSVGDHFRVEARVVLWEDERALKAPTGALFRHGTNWAAFVMGAGRANLRQVTVGRTSGIESQVLSGIQEGEDVILYPGDKIKDGQRVVPLVISFEH